jgi:hypothetical protein
VEYQQVEGGPFRALVWAEEERKVGLDGEFEWRSKWRGGGGNLSHPIYKNINRAIIYALGSSHAYIQQIIKISQHMSRIKAYKL